MTCRQLVAAQSGLMGWHLHADSTASRTSSLIVSSCKPDACGMWLQEPAISQWAQSGNRTEREQAPFTQVFFCFYPSFCTSACCLSNSHEAPAPLRVHACRIWVVQQRQRTSNFTLTLSVVRGCEMRWPAFLRYAEHEALANTRGSSCRPSVICPESCWSWNTDPKSKSGCVCPCSD